MKKNRIDWSKTDPFQYFKENCSHIKTIGQLHREHGGLYKALVRQNRLDEIKGKLHTSRWDKVDPVKYFRENCPHIKTRRQLYKIYPRVYNKLLRAGKVEEAIPYTKKTDYNKIDPIKLFHEKYSHVKSAEQLKRENGGLHAKLSKIDKLNELITSQVRDWSKIDPVKYFYEHYASSIKTITQLIKKDQGLYAKLRELKKVDIVFPSKMKFRDWNLTDPVEYYKQHYSNVKNRNELRKVDKGLHCALYRRGLLDTLFPNQTSQKAKALELVIEEYLKE